ncbi:hypothetical protein [Gordonia phthalatica]|nr:hypothetical protein [Gordonia phthalatica]
MDCLEAVGELRKAGVSLRPEQSVGDAMLVLFSALGAGVRQSVVVAPEVLDGVDELLGRVQLRPGAGTLTVALANLESLRVLSRRAA